MNIVMAGMHRSGTTWLFNVLRLLVCEGGNCYCVFVQDFDPRQMRAVNVVTAHRFDGDLVRMADVLLLTHRDVRDVVASAVRIGILEPRREVVLSWLDNMVEWEYERWRPYANLDITYWEAQFDRTTWIRKVAEAIGVTADEARASRIRDEVETIGLGSRTLERYDPVTHLHPRHVTNGVPGTFGETLSPDIVEAIERRFPGYVYLRGEITSGR